MIIIHLTCQWKHLNRCIFFLQEYHIMILLKTIYLKEECQYQWINFLFFFFVLSFSSSASVRYIKKRMRTRVLKDDYYNSHVRQTYR